jgi:hypothetical protein
MLHDNPAERLKVILQKGQSASKTGQCKETWAHILGVDPADEITVLARLGGVMELARSTQNLIKIHAPSQVATIEHWSGQLRVGLLNQNLSGPWSTFIDHIRADSIAFLSLTSEILNNKFSLKTIKEEDLKI